jgi:WD40 repeat protein
MSRFQDAFISYGRADSKAFAQKLYTLLGQQGLTVWFDFEDIPLGVDYQNQIDDGIEKSDNFLYIIAPHSVNSPYCAKEVELALKRNKRIIPLLHVEQINRETWQQRYPNGGDAEWAAYQARGAHSSFPNMHPEIAKINWVYFREGMDDFSTAFTNLLALLERQRDYVRQHTHFLAKALEWQRNKQQAQHLLVGAERQQAEAWLRVRFRHEQPPCLPTNLHCEFITESIKNANNLMTKVFLSWSDKDRALMEPVRQSLLREQITVWVSSVDIKTGSDFQTMINRGIEEADNVVYLISPNSLESRYCQAELEYAQKLNKRLIPILLCPTPLEQISAEVRSLQFIDFTDNTTAEDYQSDIAQLIRILNQDAAYYEQHKLLLTRALKWHRLQQNSSMLLRGYNLRQAEAWLKIAKKRDQHPPIAEMEAFVAESLQQPADVGLDVFVSHSQKDSEFARHLNEALQINGKTTWFEQESIAAGSSDFQQEIKSAAGTSDFQQEIHRGIESSNHFLFIISPHALESPYCAEEIDYAASLNKRMITVLSQPVNPDTLPPALANVQWIDFSRGKNDFDAKFTVLLRTLDNDPEYLRTHTGLLTRALEWDNKQRDEGLLLRGQVLQETQEWLLASENKSPQPTTLQRDYATASAGVEAQRQRSLLRLQRIGLGVISIITLVAIAAGLVAFKLYRKADRLEMEAEREEILARTRTSEAMFDSDRVLDSLLEAMEAGLQMREDKLENPRLREVVVTALGQSVFWVRERQRINGHDGIIWTTSISPDGKLIASASADGSVKVWRTDGTLVHTLEDTDKRQMLAVAFSPDGKHLATATIAGQVQLWEMDHWTATVLSNVSEPVNSLAFAPNGKLAAASDDSKIRLWDPSGKLLKTLEGHDAAVRSVTFSPDGQLLASGSDDHTIRLWQTDGTPLKTLVGHTAQVRSLSFSPDSKQLVSGSWDETIRLWQRDGTLLQTIRGHETLIHTVSFSPDGKQIASAGWDKTIKLWTLDGTLVSTLAGHTGQVRSITFNPTDGTLISTGGDRTLRLWQLRRPLLATLQDHRAKVYSATFSPDGKLLVSAGADNTVRLWDAHGTPLRRMEGHQGVIWAVHFSPDGQQILSSSSDRTLKLWSRDGKLLRTFIGHNAPIYAAEFSPDGKMIVSASADQTVRLWRPDGTLIRTLQDLKQGILTVHFSPDGQTLAIAGWNNDIQLRTLSGTLKTTLQGHRGWIYDTRFSSDGKQILTGSYDGTAKLWSVDGQLITTLKGHEDGVVSVDFSQDDKIIVTGSHDHTIKLWRRDGTLITTLRGHRDRVSDVSLSPDGKLLASASEDQTILLWDLNLHDDLEQLLLQGCRWAKDYLHTDTTTPYLQKTRHFCDAQPNSSTVGVLPPSL